MKFNDYMMETRRTRVSADPYTETINGALGLGGETGEVIEMVKKWHAHGLPLDPEKMKKELGDVQWYLARLADANVIGGLEEVARANIAKLRARYPEGFVYGGGIREGEGA